MSSRAPRLYGFPLLSLIVFACSCQRFATPSAMTFVPPDAVATISVRWNEIRNDALLAQFAPIAEIAAFLEAIGLPPEGVDSVVLFRQPDSSGDTAIVQSTASIGHIREQATGTTARLLTKTLIAIGPGRGVEAAIQTGGTRAASFLGRAELRDVGGSLEGKEPVLMALAWPQAARDTANAAIGLSGGTLKFIGFEPLGTLVEKIGIGRAMTVRCSREDDGVRLHLQAVTEDETSARLMVGGLTLLKTLAGLAPPSGTRPSPANSFQTLTVDRSGTVLSLGLLINRRDLTH